MNTGYKRENDDFTLICFDYTNSFAVLLLSSEAVCSYSD